MSEVEQEGVQRNQRCSGELAANRDCAVGSQQPALDKNQDFAKK
jgi:hypothetical protein